MTPATPLADAARCALVSLDSTIRSNLAVGPPVELAIYERDALRLSRYERYEADAPWLLDLQASWSATVARGMQVLPRFPWETSDGAGPGMSYAALHGHFEGIAHVRHAQAMLRWDEAVKMPSGGGAARAESLAELARIAHDRVADERVGDWLGEAREEVEAGGDPLAARERPRDGAGVAAGSGPAGGNSSWALSRGRHTL